MNCGVNSSQGSLKAIMQPSSKSKGRSPILSKSPHHIPPPANLLPSLTDIYPVEPLSPIDQPIPANNPQPSPETPSASLPQSTTSTAPTNPPPPSTNPSSPPTEVPSRPSRNHRPPRYLQDYLCPTLPTTTAMADSTHTPPQSSEIESGGLVSLSSTVPPPPPNLADRFQPSPATSDHQVAERVVDLLDYLVTISSTSLLGSVLVNPGIGRSSSLFDPLWCDMSGRQIHLTSPELDSGTQFSSFEDSSTSPLMANENADVNQASIDVDAEPAEGAQTQATDNQGEEEQNPFEKKSRKRTSQAWNDFETITLPDGSNKSRCKFCKQTFAIQASGATTTLLRHLGKCVQRRLAVGEIEKKQKTLSFETTGSDSCNLTTFTYDHAKVREAASHMILYHEYAFMHMEHALFNRFMKTATPHWQKISRTIAKNDCVSTYNVQKKKLKTMLKTVNRISITTDMWKSPGQKIHYMVVTGHFVDNDWKLHKRVLSFCYVPPPHNGVIISDALYKSILDWGIANKVASITVDNASYNDVALRNLKGTFKLLKKKLLFDALEFRDVFPRYGERDVGFVYVPTYEDWEKVDSVCKFLEIFDDVTNIISGSQYPTSNLFLTEVWRIKQTLDKCSEEGEEYLQTMALKMKAKFDKYWGECNLLMALGAALDPRYKMKLVGFCFPEIYNEVDASANISMVRDSLYQLYDVYVAMHTEAFNGESSQQSTTEVGSFNSGPQGKKVVTGKSRYESFVRMSDNIQPVKSDLDIYLEEHVYICNGLDSHFDAIEWWKANNLKYRILSKMACDVLSIPITSVASKAAFRAGSRVIDPYRASLATETVEMLLCGGDWVGVLYGLKRGSEVSKVC
ncbi:hypothetical protein Vadar_028912 [Vaccinium darrowii]|uniref:Uncharacterized protein n=1 Tax=Vaccinium darrowii TaxID=229202 RepID=A0ACB7XKM5_9ERIC|nr:hypothetical protein Vadar_028912 [Vaccinium darrowii]